MADATTTATAAVTLVAPPPPPIVHAIAGSIGSALALLLFYPLERARIELQTQAAKADTTRQRKQLLLSSEQVFSTTSNQDINVHDDVATQNPSSQGVVFVDAVSSIASSSTGSEKEEHIPEGSSFWMSEHESEQSIDTNSNNDNVSKKDDKDVVGHCNNLPSSWSMNTSISGSQKSDVLVEDLLTSPSIQSTQRQQQLSSLRHRLIRKFTKQSNLFKCLIDLHTRQELYKGVTPIITTIFTSQFIFFFIHAYIKKLLLNLQSQNGKNGISSQPMLSLISSCIAGIGNVIITNPLWVTNMAIITGETKTHNLWKELIKISHRQGIQHLWNGTMASILLVSNPIIQFFCYEQFKYTRLLSKNMNNNNNRDDDNNNNNTNVPIPSVTLGALEAFCIAALSKAIATITTYPLQLTQTLLRLSNDNDEDNDDNNDNTNGVTSQHKQKYKGTIDCLTKLYQRNNSIQPWFTGMRAKLLQTVLTAAFTFLTYEQIVGAVQTSTILLKAK